MTGLGNHHMDKHEGEHAPKHEIPARTGPSAEKPAWPQALALLLAIATAVAVAVYMFVPPVVPEDAPATEFSAERAMEDVRVIAREPHPMGSQEHEEVADYIVSKLRELGLCPGRTSFSCARGT